MSSDGRYQIEIIEGIDQGTVFTLFGDTIRLSGGNFTSFEDGIIKIKNSSVSSIVGVLNWEEKSNAYRLSNRSAISPVVVNGSPCSNALLVDGTLINVGDAVVEIIACEGVVANENGVLAADFSAPSSESETGIYLGEAAEQPKKRIVPAWLRTGDDAPGEAANNGPAQDLGGGQDSEEDRRGSSLGYGRHSYVPESKRQYKDYAPASHLSSKDDIEACSPSGEAAAHVSAGAQEAGADMLANTIIPEAVAFADIERELSADPEQAAAEHAIYPQGYEAPAEEAAYPQDYEAQAAGAEYQQGYEAHAAAEYPQDYEAHAAVEYPQGYEAHAAVEYPQDYEAHAAVEYPQGYEAQAAGVEFQQGYEAHAAAEYPQGYETQAEGAEYPQGYETQAEGAEYPQGYEAHAAAEYPQGYEAHAAAEYPQGYEAQAEGAEYPQGYEAQAEGAEYHQGYEAEAAGAEYAQGYDAQAAGAEYPQGYEDQAAGAEYHQGYEAEAAGAEYPQGYEDQAAGAEYAQGYEAQTAGAEYPQGYEAQAAGAEYPQGYEAQAVGAEYQQGYEEQAAGAEYQQGYEAQAAGSEYPQGYEDQAEGEAYSQPAVSQSEGAQNEGTDAAADQQFDDPNAELTDDLIYENEFGEEALGRIVVMQGRNAGRSLEVFGSFTIGRSMDNDFVLDDPYVSRLHCGIMFEEDGVYLVNYSASSTTRLGRISVTERCPLKNEATIILGNKVWLRWTQYTN